MELSNLGELFHDWIVVKAAEEAAKAKRADIERRLFDLLPDDAKPEEGSTTTRIDMYKIVVTQRINRKLDTSVLADNAVAIPADYMPTKKKIEIDKKGLDWLRKNEPGYYYVVIFMRAVTETSGKPEIKVIDLRGD